MNEMVHLIPTCIVSNKNYSRMILLNSEKQCIYMYRVERRRRVAGRGVKRRRVGGREEEEEGGVMMMRRRRYLWV